MDITDYLYWRGDLSFKNDPFNELDNILFAQICYMEFEKYFKDEKSLTIMELADRYFEGKDIDQYTNDKNVVKNQNSLFFMMALSKRFAFCKVHHCVSKIHNDENLVEKFAAMMIDLDDGSTVVAFRGTDDSLIAWKEDLMLSYRDIASQYDAVDYVNRNCRFWRKYRFVGHSKGGYLAIYAATHCNYFIQRMIIDVYSDDGPGLKKDSYDEKKYKRIKNRYKLIVPVKDGVGTIYEMARHKKIAQISVFNIFAAHNMLNWQIEGNHVLEADKNAYETDLSRKAIIQFLKDTSIEQRAIFVEEFFRALTEMNISNFSELPKAGPVALSKIMSRMTKMDEEAKSTVGKMIRAFTGNISNDLQKTISMSTDQLKNRFFRRKEEEKIKGEIVEDDDGN